MRLQTGVRDAYWNERIMPATSARPVFLMRRSVGERRGLALEVDDDEVPARVQHLAEVEVAVDADAGDVEAVAGDAR